MTVVGQTAVIYTYDNANRLTQVAQGSQVASLAYDDADRRTSVTYPNTNKVECLYNVASELTTVTYKKGTTTLGTLTYTYDAAGNRIKTGGTFARSNLPPVLATTTYHANNQQTAFGAATETYDLNGNLATVTDAGGTTMYTWNARNQLTAISGPELTGSFTYDSFGRRIGRTVNGTVINYVYDGLNPVKRPLGVRSCNHAASRVDSRAMARPLRLEFPGAVYHVTSRGNARQDIVADDRDRAQFLALLAHVVDRYGWLCHGYCVMDNHYHLLIETPQPNLSLGMRQLNGRYTQTYNRRHERVGHLFQGRFTAILVEKEAYLLELCRYVVLNPVRANIVRHPRHWVWSSYRAMVGETPAPPFLTTDWILGHFGQRVSSAHEKYRTFVAEGRGGPRPWEQLTGQIYLGSESFIAQHQPDRVMRDIPRRQTQAQRPPLRVLFQGSGAPARLIHTAYRRYGYRLAEIAAHLGVHAATVSRRLKQAEQGNA